jgi:hypothetical protein
MPKLYLPDGWMRNLAEPECTRDIAGVSPRIPCKKAVWMQWFEEMLPA